MNDRRYYVYAFVVDGVVRYIGKGSKSRLQQHMQIVRRISRERAAGKKVKAEYFHNKLRKEWLGGAVVAPTLIAEGLTEDEAYERERAEIAAAAPGQLWNQKAGGREGVGYTLESRDRIRQAALKRYQDPAERARAAAHISDVARRPETRAMSSERQRRRFAEGDPLMRKFHKAAHTPAVYKKRGETLKRTNSERPEIVIARAERSAAWWARPENNSAMRAKLSEAHARPDVKAKRRAYYDSPEGRANLKAAALVSAAAKKARAAERRQERLAV